MQELIEARDASNTAAKEQMLSKLQAKQDESTQPHLISTRFNGSAESPQRSSDPDYDAIGAPAAVNDTLSTVCAEGCDSKRTLVQRRQCGQLTSLASPQKKNQNGRPSRQQVRSTIGTIQDPPGGSVVRPPQHTALQSSQRRAVPVKAQKNSSVAFGRSTAPRKVPKRFDRCTGGAATDESIHLQRSVADERRDLQQGAKAEGRNKRTEISASPHGSAGVETAYREAEREHKRMHAKEAWDSKRRGGEEAYGGVETGERGVNQWSSSDRSWQPKDGAVPDCMRRHRQEMECNLQGCETSHCSLDAAQCSGKEQRQDFADEGQLQGRSPRHMLCMANKKCKARGGSLALDGNPAASTGTLPHSSRFLLADGCLLKSDRLRALASQPIIATSQTCCEAGPISGARGDVEGRTGPQPFHVVSHYLPREVCAIPPNPQNVLLSDKCLHLVLLSTDTQMKHKQAVGVMTQASPSQSLHPSSKVADGRACKKGRVASAEGKPVEQLGGDVAASNHMRGQHNGTRSHRADCVQDALRQCHPLETEPPARVCVSPQNPAPFQSTSQTAPSSVTSSVIVSKERSVAHGSRGASVDCQSQGSQASKSSSSAHDPDSRCAQSQKQADRRTSDQQASCAGTSAVQNAEGSMSSEAYRASARSLVPSRSTSTAAECRYARSSLRSCSPAGIPEMQCKSAQLKTPFKELDCSPAGISEVCCVSAPLEVQGVGELDCADANGLEGPHADCGSAVDTSCLQELIETSGSTAVLTEAGDECVYRSSCIQQSKCLGSEALGSESLHGVPGHSGCCSESSAGSKQRSDIACGDGMHVQSQHELGQKEAISAADRQSRRGSAVAVSEGMREPLRYKPAEITEECAAVCQPQAQHESWRADSRTRTQLSGERSGTDVLANKAEMHAKDMPQQGCTQVAEIANDAAMGREPLPGSACVQQAHEAERDVGGAPHGVRKAELTETQCGPVSSVDGARQLHSDASVSAVRGNEMQESQVFPGYEAVVDNRLDWLHDNEDVVCTGLGTASPVCCLLEHATPEDCD
jgi:hypothetical protein